MILAIFTYSRAKLVSNFALVSIYVILVVFAGTRYYIDNDYYLYDYLFYAASTKPIVFLADNPSLEWCVWLVSKFSQLFFGAYKDSSYMSFIVFAILGVGFKMLGIIRNSASIFFAIFLYLGNSYLGQEMTTIRAGVAAGIFLYAVKDLSNKNDRGFLIKILFALLFHYSAAIFFVIWLILKLKIKLKYFVIVTFLCLVFPATKLNLLEMLYLDRFVPKVQIYSEIAKQGIGVEELNVFNFKIIISLFVLIVFMLFYKKVVADEKLVIWLKIHCLSIVIFFVLSPVQMTFSLRTFELVSVIQILLFPTLIMLFPRRFKYIPIIMIIFISMFQIYYYIDISGNYKPYESWLLK